MKKVSLFLLLLALGYVSCDRQHKNTPNNDVKEAAVVEQPSEPTEVEPMEPVEPLEPIEPFHFDMALLERGELSFYDANSKKLLEVEKETDSVLNGAFVDDKFYYCVAKGHDVILKYVDLNADLNPVMAFDMGLKVDSCISETYGHFSGLEYIPKKHLLCVGHNFSWDGYDFSDTRVCNLSTGKVWDWDWEADGGLRDYDDEDEEDDEDDSEIGDPEDEYEFFSDGDQYYFKTESDIICLTNQMNVQQYVSDPDYAIPTDFYGYGVSPKGDMVLFGAALETGDFEHGPFCVASLDGSFQMVLDDTDMAETRANWLSNGSLVYQGDNGSSIKILYPDRQMAVLSYANDFIVRNN